MCVRGKCTKVLVHEVRAPVVWPQVRCSGQATATGSLPEVYKERLGEKMNASHEEMVDYTQWMMVPREWRTQHCERCNRATFREKGICPRCDPEVRAGLIARADRNDPRPAMGLGKLFGARLKDYKNK